MANQIKLPSNPELATRIVEANHIVQNKILDIGLFGRIFGAASEKPGNIAGAIVAISIFSLVMFLFIDLPNSSDFGKKDVISVFSGFITLSLGYLFGKSSK